MECDRASANRYAAWWHGVSEDGITLAHEVHLLASGEAQFTRSEYREAVPDSQT